MNKKFKFTTLGVVLIWVVVIALNCCSTIGPTERGIKVTLGKPGDDVISPGLHFKAPFVQSVQKFDLTPIEYKQDFSIGDDGAISKDLQTVGVSFTLYWKYDENRIPDVIRNYKTKESIYQPISSAVKAALKGEIGKYSIEEIIANQTTISNNVKSSFMAEIEYLPIIVTDFKIGNYNWDESYDNMIRETMNRKQQVEQMKQEVALSEQSAQKQVKEAQARLEAEKLNAEAVRVKAQAEADAEKISADATAYKNTKIAQNLTVELKLKELEINKIRAERWNGVEVSSQSIYVPNTYDLKSGK